MTRTIRLPTRFKRPFPRCQPFLVFLLSGLLGFWRTLVAEERDPSFDVHLEAAGRVTAMAAYTNGSILIGGTFHRVGDAPRSGCALLDREGNLVREFVPDLGKSANILSIAVQPDQKILVTGWFNLEPTRARPNIARLNPDGSLDETFKLPFEWLYSLPTVAVMPDGQPLFGGQLNPGEFHLFRLDSQGTPDSDFTFAATASNYLESLNLFADPSGKIYVAGDYRDFRNTGRNYLVRLRADGSLDPSFFTESGFDHAVLAVAIDADGRVVTGGSFRFFNNALRPGIARLHPDGSLDLEFKPLEIEFATVRSVLALSDGGVLMGGECWLKGETSPWGLVRLNRFGVVDRHQLRLSLIGDRFDREVTTLVSSTEGWIWAGGSRLEESAALPSPLLQMSLTNDSPAVVGPKIARHGIATSMKPTSTGGLIIAGDFDSVDQELRPGLAKIRPDGSPDPGFVPTVGRLSYVDALAVDPSGQVYVGIYTGSFTPFEQTVARFRPDGALDPNYATLKIQSSVREMYLDGAGDLVISGFSFPAEPNLGAVVRLGPDGSTRSNAFVGSSGLFSTFALLPMPDGGVICGGNFGYLPSEPGPRYLARLSPSGSLDPTFRITNATGDDQPLDSVVTSLSVDSKGRIIVGGWFRRVGNQEVPGILRLLPDGRLDSSFQPSFIGYDVSEVWVDSKDRIIARGRFASSLVTPVQTILRVHPDGTVDSTFPVITPYVGSIAVLGDDVFLSVAEAQFSGAFPGEVIRIGAVRNDLRLSALLGATGAMELRLLTGGDRPLRLESSFDLRTWTPIGPADGVMHIAPPLDSRVLYYRVVEVEEGNPSSGDH